MAIPISRLLAALALISASALGAQTSGEATGRPMAAFREEPSRSPVLPPFDSSGIPSPPLLFDEPGDGAIWVRGETYKASFGATGATYIPYLGSHAPRNFPVRFRVSSASAAGKEIALAESVAPRREGDSIVYDRGAIEERYLCGPRGVEQVFVVGGNVGAGDLVVRMEVETDLVLKGGGEEGFVFSAAGLGSVRYGRGVASNALGGRADVLESWDGRGIELRVPGSFVAKADGPITIDPLISTFCIACSPFSDTLDPDVSYDATNDRFMIAYELPFSATDGDVRTAEFDPNGAFVPGSLANIDTTADDWRAPRIANNNASNRHLIVARGPYEVRGRIRNAGSTSMLPQVLIATTTVPVARADVGGDSTPAGPTPFCVAYSAQSCGLGGCGAGLLYQLLDSNGALTIGGYIPGSGSAMGELVGISNSNGGAAWTIAADLTGPISPPIWAVQVGSDGSLSPQFEVSTSGVNAGYDPAVTSPDAQGRVLVAWVKSIAGGSAIYGRILQGATALTPETDLSALAGGFSSASFDVSPSADADGCGFTVAFLERNAFSTITDIYAATFGYSPTGEITVTQAAQPIYIGGPYVDGAPRIVSKTSGGGPGPRHLIVWDRQDPAVPLDHDIVGGTFDSLPSFCFPSGVACPLFAENFEGVGLGAYVETPGTVPGPNLWHGETNCSAGTAVAPSFGTKAAAYNQGYVGVYNFATSTPLGATSNSGAIESPVIPSTAGASLFLGFDYTRETETGATFDQSFVEVRPAGGSWVLATQIVEQHTCLVPVHAWVQAPLPGGSWQHRFRFETVDANFNNGRGWYVDNVEAVQVASSGGSFTTLPTGCGALALAPTGLPVIGGAVTYTLSGTTGLALVWLGGPTAIPLCPPAPCALGATPGIVLVAPVLSGAIPCDTSLMGASFWVQGADVGGAGGCGAATFGIPIVVSPTVQTTIG